MRTVTFVGFVAGFDDEEEEEEAEDGATDDDDVDCDP